MALKKIFPELRLYLCNRLVTNIPSHTFRLWYYRKVMGFKVGKGSTIYMGCTFDSAKGLEIGWNSVVNANCRIDTRGGIKIGNNVSISNDVIILTADHDIDNHMTGRQKTVVIDDFAWIGTRAMILPGVIVGKGGVIAAGALLTKSIEPLAVVAGVPAKKIRERAPHLGYSASSIRLFK